MVAHLVRLKLTLLRNGLRRSPWQVVGLVVGALYGLGRRWPSSWRRWRCSACRSPTSAGSWSCSLGSAARPRAGGWSRSSRSGWTRRSTRRGSSRSRIPQRSLLDGPRARRAHRHPRRGHRGLARSRWRACGGGRPPALVVGARLLGARAGDVRHRRAGDDLGRLARCVGQPTLPRGHGRASRSCRSSSIGPLLGAAVVGRRRITADARSSGSRRSCRWTPVRCRLGRPGRRRRRASGGWRRRASAIAVATLVVVAVVWDRALRARAGEPAPTRRSPRKGRGLGWFDRLPATPLGAVTARCLTYWARDPRYALAVADRPGPRDRPVHRQPGRRGRPAHRPDRRVPHGLGHLRRRRLRRHRLLDARRGTPARHAPTGWAGSSRPG